MPWKFDCPECEKEFLLENKEELKMRANNHCAGKHPDFSNEDIEKEIEKIERSPS